MKIKMKYVVIAVVLASFAAIIYGFILKEENESLAHKYIGSGTIGLFLVAMPLFLIKESQGKQMKDYMLTKENIEKMNKREKEQESRK
ncbi:Hypothetical protein I595_1635 [Croceitalea dokdonensis DOKDO 023]|uniref:Isoleucyl-tRNA synthetase n=1 Tax=Croceitalea dokdonensis DOKDO 023 TaxID=1300341 RepID=A0A0P7AJK2_9FLAO|nr:hypothetical protein [Croceitalea dokdonensis]KPM31987.1 Hypothetical protein I595_1635 [Croceitalea dokdonensis DOKDO 023]